MTEIHFKYNPEDLRDIYFGENKHKYLFGPETKKQSTFLIIAICVYPFYFWYTLNLEDDGLFIVGGMIFAWVCFDFRKVAKPIIEWKKSVLKFLADAEKIKELKVMYNNESIIHKQDNEEIKMNWSVIDHATINDRFIGLHASQNFIFPKSSMTDDEYKNLANIIIEKVKNVEKR